MARMILCGIPTNYNVVYSHFIGGFPLHTSENGWKLLPLRVVLDRLCSVVPLQLLRRCHQIALWGKFFVLFYFFTFSLFTFKGGDTC